jgi:DNA-binding response OmpR family regulator
MASSVKATKSARSATTKPRILVVDDEQSLLELVDDVVGRSLPCNIIAAGSITDAKKILATQPIELMLADVNLPDGNGTTLLSTLRQQQPEASAIVITGAPSIDGVVSALRNGALDFLPKPFTAEHLLDRVTRALERQRLHAKKERRLDRLRDAVKRLNEARRVVSKKVDLLCNDLITAYGELSKQVDVVRTQENFRKLLAEADDLEQLLCHAMDWLLRQLGYANVAVWLAAEDGEFQLGAYMKYTIPGDPALTDAMRKGLVAAVTRDGFLHLKPEEIAAKATPAEMKYIAGQTVLACNCTYLGEALAAVVLYRDAKTPFSDEDAAALKAVSPIFATALASVVRGSDGEDDDDTGDDRDGGASPFYDGPPPKDNEPKKKKDEADWWKRGEAPPF